MRTRPFCILISTGDVMGDMHGAALVRALIDATGEEKVEIEVYAMGGKRMKDEGTVLIGDNTGLSSIGLLEALPLVIPSIQIQIRTRKFHIDGRWEMVPYWQEMGVSFEVLCDW
ncbi:hypothetical protein KC19_VG329900 [Ceratodon purpureus]|uniref:lipid-A-disaccharide synthase n=1 Tax=Ceratodon purpureus TaxID=3225 RepID=A0A8T0HWT5_CERPU|nr:hypothetical protein KC19_VG329900 [Ceratodon purpureus]